MLLTYHLETFGCQMNKSDSTLIALSLREHGFAEASSPETADIVIFNTCAVRQHAEDRAMARIAGVRGRVTARRGLVVVAGCMAQRRGQELRDSGLADIVVGPFQSPELGSIIRCRIMDDGAALFLSQEDRDFAGRIRKGLSRLPEEPSWHRWVTITHGCENFCAYCIVPSVRGRLISLPSASVIAHVGELADQGVREVTLLGQNVNQYGTDSGDMPFHRLLARVGAIPGLERINFLTSHPRDFTEDIFHVIAENPAISRGIHLPLQSGSDRILAMMNRGYSREQYYRLIDAMERILGDFSVSTDIIVGFPGEEEIDFRDTLDAIRRIRFDDAFMYAYSPREGTPAASLAETLSHSEKIARLQELITLQREQSRDKLRSRIGRVEEARIEGPSRKSPHEVLGKTILNHMVVVPGTSDDIGRLLRVRITGVSGSTLQGARIA